MFGQLGGFDDDGGDYYGKPKESSYGPEYRTPAQKIKDKAAAKARNEANLNRLKNLVGGDANLSELSRQTKDRDAKIKENRRRAMWNPMESSADVTRRQGVVNAATQKVMGM